MPRPSAVHAPVPGCLLSLAAEMLCTLRVLQGYFVRLLDDFWWTGEQLPCICWEWQGRGAGCAAPWLCCPCRCCMRAPDAQHATH